MSKLKKIGIILILFGIGLPLILLAFATPGYITKLGLILNIQTMEIVIRENIAVDIGQLKEAGFTEQEIQSHLKETGFSDREIKEAKIGDMFKEMQEENIITDIFSHLSKTIEKEKIAIPYRYVFATGIISVLTGIGIIILSTNRRSGATS